MAKPNVLANWATDDNYPAGSEPEAGTPTKVPYTLGQEQIGWRPKQRPAAQELNTWMHRVGLWIAYLNAGVWDDDLHVTGKLTVDGHIDSGLGALMVEVPVTIDGMIDVDTVYFNENELLSIPVGEAIDDAGDLLPELGHTIKHNAVIVGSSSAPVYFPIRLPAGAVVTGYRVELQKNTDSDEEVLFDIVESNRGTDNVIDAANLSTSNAQNQPGDVVVEVAADSGECPIQAGRIYWLRVSLNPGSTAGDRIHAVDIYWRKPQL